MATKTKSRSTALARTPRAPAPIVITKTRTVHAKAKKTKHHRGGGGESSLMHLAIAAYVIGYLDKTGTAIPTVPVLGRAGTLAVGAHFLGKGKKGLVTSVRNAAAVIALYEMGSKGSVSGEGGPGADGLM